MLLRWSKYWEDYFSVFRDLYETEKQMVAVKLAQVHTYTYLVQNEG